MREMYHNIQDYICICNLLNEPRREKTWFLHMRKQRRRSASPLFLLHGQCLPSTSYIRNFKHLAIFSECPARFVWDLVGKPRRPVFSQRSSLIIAFTHYANVSEQFTAIFHGCKNGNFQMKKKCDIFLFLLKKHRSTEADRGHFALRNWKGLDT